MCAYCLVRVRLCVCLSLCHVKIVACKILLAITGLWANDNHRMGIIYRKLYFILNEGKFPRLMEYSHVLVHTDKMNSERENCSRSLRSGGKKKEHREEWEGETERKRENERARARRRGMNANIFLSSLIFTSIIRIITNLLLFLRWLACTSESSLCTVFMRHAYRLAAFANYAKGQKLRTTLFCYFFSLFPSHSK